MYRDHVPRIAAHATASPDGLADLLTFVLVTIRVQFSRVPDAMDDVRKNGVDARALWGWKREGVEYVRANRDRLYLETCALDDPETTIELVDLFAVHVPGLAIVKAAFVAQMLGHNVACMDSRNLEALGYGGQRPFREFARKNGRCVVGEGTRHRRIAEYVDATRASGGSEHWWNSWCDGIAPSLLLTGEDVSRWHVEQVTKGSGIK